MVVVAARLRCGLGMQKTKAVTPSTAARNTWGRFKACISHSPPVYHPTLHHESDFLYHADVLQRIPRNSDNISKIAALQRADLSFPAKQFCAVEQARLERGQRSHAVLDHE